MTLCLNPTCSRSPNPDNAKFCQNCGSKLLLGDRYRALVVIGQGGFGRTFLARDEGKMPEAGESGGQPKGISETETGAKECVIKQLLPRAEVNWQKATELFRQEADRLAELGRHPQVPALLAHYELENAQYLVQEFVDGLNLEEILQEQGTFTEAQIRQLLADLLPLLRYIHSRRIIHRDIKPENIILPASNGRYTLVDFGASKSTTDTALAHTGTVIGSAGYVAPEQAIGRAEFASDLYSLGVTCIYLLTSVHPFDLYSVSQDIWVWQEYLPQPISLPMRRVLDRLIQKPTGKRYSHASQVLQDLQIEDPKAQTPKPKLQTPNSKTQTPNFSLPAQSYQLPIAPFNRSPLRPQVWQCMKTLTGHTAPITAIAIDSEAVLLASGSIDKTVKLWDLTTGQLYHSFNGRSVWGGNGHRDRITALVFSTEGYTVFSGSTDGTIKEWDSDTLQLVLSLPGQVWDLSALALSRDEWTLVSGSGEGIIHLWDLETEAIVANLSGHSGKISALLLTPDGRSLISSSFDRTIRIWDLHRRQLLNTLQGHLEAVSAIAVTPNWQTLVSASWDKTIKLWDLKTGEQIKVLAAHRDRIHCLAMHPQGQLFASGCEDGSITLWEVATGERLTSLGHLWGVNTIAFSPDGNWFVSGSSDETVKIWQPSRD